MPKSVECVAFPAKNGGYHAFSIATVDYVYVSDGLLRAQNILVESLHSGLMGPRPLTEQVHLRFRMAQAAIKGIFRNIDYAHWHQSISEPNT